MLVKCFSSELGFVAVLLPCIRAMIRLAKAFSSARRTCDSHSFAFTTANRAGGGTPSTASLKRRVCEWVPRFTADATCRM